MTEVKEFSFFLVRQKVVYLNQNLFHFSLAINDEWENFQFSVQIKQKGLNGFFKFKKKELQIEQLFAL